MGRSIGEGAGVRRLAAETCAIDLVLHFRLEFMWRTCFSQYGSDNQQKLCAQKFYGCATTSAFC